MDRVAFKIKAFSGFVLWVCLISGALQLLAKKGYAQSDSRLWHHVKRELRYHPDGRDFVIVNGRHRFNRALYGTNTAFRVEAGDLPEFALYLPGMGGNLKMGLINGDQSKWLINAGFIKARYRPGSMIYKIKDALLGKNGVLDIEVLAGSSAENMLIKARFSNTGKQVRLFWAFGGATGKKFSRDGDIGADPESGFEMQPDYCKGNDFKITEGHFTLNFNGKSLSEAGRYENGQVKSDEQKKEVVAKNVLYGIYPACANVHLVSANEQSSPLIMLNSNAVDKPAIAGLVNGNKDENIFWAIQNGKPFEHSNPELLFNEAAAYIKKLASRVVVSTPDPYINTLGGALSVAADGIWESPSYLHGAVAWRMRLPAWRGPYVADPLGWHDRARSHFSSYALSQITEPTSGPVIADTALHIARQLEKLGTAMFSSGYISRNPGGDIRPHHYDMNLVYIDALLNHFKWTGDLNEVKKMWPLIQRHLAWEKRNFDADGDGLYDAYCAIWASDALQYSGGGVTHTSAYNYRANKAAVYLAQLIGEDPEPYRQEADKIVTAINKTLWIRGTGNYAEYQDLLGLRLLHPSAGLWTIYHAIDSEIPDTFQAYQALRYVDTEIPHIPVIAKGLSGNNYLLSTTNWLPYDWSLNNVVMAENLHMALAYWQGNQQENAFTLWKSAILESMYLGTSPGNFQQISFYDVHRGELYRDFADPIGMAARSLVEGLFGIKPDLLKDTLTIKPGLPQQWNYASLSVPDIKFDYKHVGQTDTYTIKPAFNKVPVLKFQILARSVSVQSVTVNGRPAKWTAVPSAVGNPVLQIIAGKQSIWKIKITWGEVKPQTECAETSYGINSTLTHRFDKAQVININDPQQILAHAIIKGKNIMAILSSSTGNHTFFVQLKQGSFNWWQPVNIKITKSFTIIADTLQNSNELGFKVINNGSERYITVTVNPELKTAYHSDIIIKPKGKSAHVTIPAFNLVPGSNHIRLSDGRNILDTTLINWNINKSPDWKPETVNLSAYFNDKLKQIFLNKYLSPRPKSPTLQLPWQGIGNWAYPLITANIDNSGLKKAASKNNGVFKLPNQIPFITPVDDSKNILFTSRWDNYPNEVNIPLTGNAVHAYLLMAGSTNPMQSRITNAVVTISYNDGTNAILNIKNPENWWPIEQDDDYDGFAFKTGAPKPLRVYFKTGEITTDYQQYITIKGYTNKGIDGGAGTVLDLPLDGKKQLKSIQLKTLANDVVIGLMGVTLMRQ
ncbi:DUF4450 domain-containing protein [Mucilaginibacter sp. SP1R1]|uniref:DUF4450 domain-containing protein n=1 Tax=Mucilaginibacter sp. SP1R1 TaxID=2723091 RepID=UPI00160A0984|nr:DUF4450 domain-containing protein [Mucilaginibacter sp. SP1R1]MBB6148924.1 hypothetical protein [Mucilaginibacter sp. SP1R1]